MNAEIGNKAEQFNFLGILVPNFWCIVISKTIYISSQTK
jgi:hypothetical protein